MQNPNFFSEEGQCPLLRPLLHWGGETSSPHLRRLWRLLAPTALDLAALDASSSRLRRFVLSEYVAFNVPLDTL